jgi:hypothetical protein
MRIVTMIALVVGAYVAGMNGITHVEVMEYVESSMTYVEGMIEYAENFRNDAETIIEDTTNYIGMR